LLAVQFERLFTSYLFLLLVDGVGHDAEGQAVFLNGIELDYPESDGRKHLLSRHSRLSVQAKRCSSGYNQTPLCGISILRAVLSPKKKSSSMKLNSAMKMLAKKAVQKLDT
jgi:hypothetical protein